MALRSSSKDIAHLLVVVVAAAVIAALYFAKVVLVPLALATFLAFVLTPVARLFERLHLGRAFSTLTVVLLTLVLAGGVGWIVARQIVDVLSQIPEYRSNLQLRMGSLHVSNPALKNAASALDQLSKTWAATSPHSSPNAGFRQRVPNSAAKTTQPLPVQVVTPAKLPVDSVQTLFGWLLQVLTVIVLTAFMLVQRESLRNRFISLVGQHRLTTTTYAIDEASDRVSRYLRTQVIVNAVYGAVIGIGLHFIGIPGGLLWGLIVGILKFLPYIGPPLGGAMPVLLSLAIFPGWKGPLLTMGLFVTVELLSSYVVEPMWYGTYTGVSPLAILVAAIFWTFLWGPIGLVLSTPLTVCLVVVGRHVPQLGFLSLLLGDEPVLAADARVYQRLLATDPEEAEQVLESLLAQKSLAEVYDSVLLPVMNLAEQDRHQDRLDDASEKLICQSVREIIDDLFERYRESGAGGTDADARGESAQGHDAERGKRAYRVLCIPARDEADEIVGIMLAQLLEQAGHTARCLACEGQKEMVRQVQTEAPDIVCISALSPFVISHTRSLYRDLRAQAPKLDIVVGLWSFPGDISKVTRRLGLGNEAAPAMTLAGVVQLVSDPQPVNLAPELAPAAEA
jgi:predicted PurR-regulated permease PerM